MGTGASGDKSVDLSKEAHGAKDKDEDEEKIRKDLQELRNDIGKDARHLSEHLMIKMSPEGIVLEVVDSDSSPLFQVGNSEPTALLQELLTTISGTLDSFENNLKIVGHTDSLQYKSGNGYDNWNLSADRANVIRRLLLENGLPQARLSEVSGRADTDPLVPDDPSASQNRRISIVILTDAMAKGESRLSAY